MEPSNMTKKMVMVDYSGMMILFIQDYSKMQASINKVVNIMASGLIVKEMAKVYNLGLMVEDMKVILKIVREREMEYTQRVMEANMRVSG